MPERIRLQMPNQTKGQKRTDAATPEAESNMHLKSALKVSWHNKHVIEWGFRIVDKQMRGRLTESYKCPAPTAEQPPCVDQFQ